MQESANNPYIPRESDEIRQKVYERQSPLGRVVKWALIITAVVAVLIGIGFFFVVPRTTAVDQPARQKLADALQPPDQMLKRVAVASQLGFDLNYDNRVYDSYGEVGDATAGTDTSSAVLSGQTYENNDLRVGRAYNYVRIRPSESVDTSRSLTPLPPQLEIFATVTNTDLAKAAAVPENKDLSLLSLFVKLDNDKRLAKKVTDDGTVLTIDATKPVSVTIRNVEYQKVRYTTTNDNHRISDVKYDECYYTIQNDQPYSICISNVRPTSVSAASLVENVFNSVSFVQPTDGVDRSGAATKPTGTKKVSFMYPLARLAQATTNDASDTTDVTDDTAGVAETADATESPLMTVKPQYYEDANSLMSLAKTQPSVVRIGMLYCANLSLKFVSGETATTITNACVGNVASGVLISKDGYIATTGHAIREQKKAAIGGYINFAPTQDEMLTRLQNVLDYLLKSKIILESDADYLKVGATNGDQEALAKIQNIGSVIPDNFIIPVNEEYTYAVQPTDKPIVIDKSDSTKPKFAYSDTVLKAKYVASNYDASKSIQEVFASDTPSVDVGLLKADGDFQDAPIATVADVKTDDVVTTLGFPAYTDSSLTIDKIRNQPVVTSNKVQQVYKKGTGQLIQTDMPVLPGNDGAPVVDKNGKLVGLAVYGLSYCPDQQCFANGTVRPIAELTKLLDDSNIKLQTGSDATKQWTEGVDQYFRANYSASTSAFSDAASLYPFNAWGKTLQKLASSQQGTEKDTSLFNQLQAAMIVTLIILAVVTVVLAVALVLHRRRIDMMQVGHYGAAADTNVVSPTLGAAPVALPSLPQVQPIAQVPPAQPPVPSYGQQPAQPTVPQPLQTESPVISLHGHNAPVQPQPPVQPAQPVNPVQPLTPPAGPVQPESSEPKDSFYS